MTSGAKTLSEGTVSLADGAGALADGAKELDDGAKALADGAKKLDDGAAELKDGVKELDDGAAELMDGAKKLSDGSAELSDGANTLRTDGTAKLKDQLLDAEKEAAEKLLPYADTDLRKAVRIFDATKDGAAQSGYDLRPEGMTTVTVYILRTDLD